MARSAARQEGEDGNRRAELIGAVPAFGMQGLVCGAAARHGRVGGATARHLRHWRTATLHKRGRIFAPVMEMLRAMRRERIEIFGGGGQPVFGVAALFYEGLENRLASNSQHGGKEETDSGGEDKVAANQILDRDASRAEKENARRRDQP